MGLREVTEAFEVIFDERSISATRKFIYSTMEDGKTATLPTIGEILKDPIPGLAEPDFTRTTCRRIVKRLVALDPGTVEYTCTYSNEPTDEAQFNGGTQAYQSLPQSQEFGGEYNLMDDPSSGWTWDEAGTEKVDVPISYAVATSTKKITRIMTYEQFAQFEPEAKRNLGCVNEAANIPGPGGIHCWLFTSYTTESYYNWKDELTYRAELVFQYRDPDGTDDDGWNKILKSDSTWGTPFDENNDKLYTEANFETLFS